jgi:hypothetical protein
MLLNLDPPSPGELLVAQRKPDGAIVALCLDASAGRLTELIWRPGESLAARVVSLSAPVIEHPAGASLAGDDLLLSDMNEKLMLVGRQTGVVAQLPPTPAPAVLTPDGKAVVSVADHGGLLSHAVLRFDARPPTLDLPRPMLVMDLDSPRSLMLVPGDNPSRFSLAIGCYGCVALVAVARFAPSPAEASSRLVYTSELPYDPIFLQRPAPPTNDPANFVFGTDWGRAGLAAIALGAGEMQKCQLADRDYGAVGDILPRLDGGACLLETRDRRLWRWEPGTDPMPVTGLGGMPLLWHGDHVLVLDAGEGIVREAGLQG